MALLVCPDCGKPYPETGPACPECGCPAEAASPAPSEDPEALSFYQGFTEDPHTRVIQNRRQGMRVAERFELVEAIVLEPAAEIWKALELSPGGTASGNGTEVVLRFLPPQIGGSVVEASRMKESVEAVRGLRHPHILPLRELVRDGDEFILAMEYVQGEDLTEYRRQLPGGRVSYEEALRLCREAAEALDYAHAAGVLHRDVRPHNIVRTRTGGAAVRNFGVTADIRHSLRRAGFDTSDTPEARLYMAPELWEGKPPRAGSDQYALAAVWCELVTGTPLFAGADPATFQAARESVAIPDGIQPEAVPALRRALAVDPEARFDSCRAMMDGLEGLEAPEVTVEEMGSPVPVAVAEWLAQAPMGLDGVDAHGRTLADYALADGREDVAAWLRSEGAKEHG